jgi:hypothetical protein
MQFGLTETQQMLKNAAQLHAPIFRIEQNLMRPDHDFAHTQLTRDQQVNTQNAVESYQ